jgi:UTP-glucose-1-phosphate uridylyltransferase
MAEVKKTPTPKPVIEEAVVETPVEEVAEVVVEDVIVTPEPKKDVPTLSFDKDGVMGSTTTNAGKAKVEKIEVAESTTTKVALFSTRNMYADGFGKINVGYNIVAKKHVDFWVAQKGVRLATPEEVAEAFA